MKEFIKKFMERIGIVDKRSSVSCLISALLSFVLYIIDTTGGALMAIGAILSGAVSYFIENKLVSEEDRNVKLPIAIIVIYLVVLVLSAIILRLH